jgi:hypothetical protein
MDAGMKNRDRQVAVLIASGLTGHEVGQKLGLADRTVDSIKAQPDVRAYIEQLEEDGITPRMKLEALMHSANDQTALRAAEALARLGGPETAPSQGGYAHIHFTYCPTCREVGPRSLTETDEPPPDFPAPANPRLAPGYEHLNPNEAGAP